MKYVAYYRVSTNKQGRSGLGLEGQQKSVMNCLSQIPNCELVASFTEIESGKIDDRPQLNEALQLCKDNNYTLLIAKLDRLSRNVEFLFHIKNSGVDIHCVDLPQLNTLTLGIYATLAQHERELIGQRTKAALQAKKARGVKLGAPNATFTNIMRTNALEAIQKKAQSNENTIRAVEAIRMKLQETKNLSQIAAYLNEKHFQTAKGKAFRAEQVKRLIEKYEL
ncbi:recombinase family protein [Parabacteroides hominis]|uniref:Recombinase family protein n=1 Tax=Parabacteroides hominis TaxID=2763057 RepID=A0ABR7DN02_9BACT|nr:recombinase family protein [Parabacteroides hominis]MBC5632814.1 recombinase family protein [Parabacteroides hominis]MBD9166185.1 recombinase family protein [Parabacteroides johnsonii]